MTIEEFFINYLNEEFSIDSTNVIPAYGDEPTSAPPKFFTVEMVGGGRTQHIDHADIAVQSWAPSRAEAAALNQQLIEVMLKATTKDEISSCKLDNTYNFTDTEKKKFRYQAIFNTVYFLDNQEE